MTDQVTNLGWHQVGCSIPDAWTSDGERPIHQMKSAYAARGASRHQLISFLDVGRRLVDRTLPGTPERDH